MLPTLNINVPCPPIFAFVGYFITSGMKSVAARGNCYLWILYFPIGIRLCSDFRTDRMSDSISCRRVPRGTSLSHIYEAKYRIVKN